MEKTINQMKAAITAGELLFDWIDYWLCGGDRPRYTIWRASS